MATSIISNAYNNVNTITSTGATSQTWATKLATIATAYESLTSTQKIHSYISVGSSAYQRTSSGIYVCTEWGSTDLSQIRIVFIDLNNKKRIVIAFKNNGTFTWTDTTDNATTSNIFLNIIP